MADYKTMNAEKLALKSGSRPGFAGGAQSHDRLQPLRRRVYELLEPGSGSDLFCRLVNFFLVSLILLNVAAVIFASMESFANAYRDALRTLELFSVAIFTVEYLLRAWSSNEAPEFAGVGTPLKARLRFLVSGSALIDLLAVLPFYLVAFGLFGNADLRVLRLFRLIRLLKLVRYAGSLTLLIQVLRENGRNFCAAIGILLMIMLLAATGIYVLEREAQPEAFGSIPAAMWWAFATLTTVGYGDVTPITAIGRVFGAAITVVSVGIVALPAGLLASSFSERLRQKSDRYRRLADEAVADGVVDEQESAALERERRELGIGEDLAATIILDEKHRISKANRCPHCGQHMSSQV